MATISASPRVAPLRWSSGPAVGRVPQRPATGEATQRESVPAVVSEVMDWRIVGWIVAVFVGTLVVSGVFAQLAPFGAAPRPVARTVAAGPAESAAHPAYSVASGDTLWDIARRAAPGRDPRATVGEIRELNGLANGHVLQAGEVLLLPSVPNA